MISIAILTLLFLACLLINAWAIARSARAMGSPRDKLRFAFAAMLAFVVIEILAWVFRAAIPTGQIVPPWLNLLVLLIAEFCAIFLVLQRMFRLSKRRTAAVFAIYFLINAAQFALAYFVVRPFLTEPFFMPTASMSPTIEPGDHILVNKIIRPNRWDIIAYHNAPRGPVYTKRVIALPGEKLRFENGNIFINDAEQKSPPVIEGRCHAWPGPYSSPQARYQDGDTITLQANEYFVIGDNVQISADSRTYGPATASSIVGVVDAIYWPLKEIRISRRWAAS